MSRILSSGTARRAGVLLAGAGAAMALLAAAGCGGGGSRRDAAADPCPTGPRLAVGAPARSRARLVSRDYGLRTCAYAGRRGAVRLTVDSLPQAARRWADSEEEQGQNTACWAQIPARRPQPVDGVGVGAYWVPATRQLLGTDGRRLVTVAVERPRGPRARALAVRVGRAALGPAAAR